jgi:hypothetical protein
MIRNLARFIAAAAWLCVSGAASGSAEPAIRIESLGPNEIAASGLGVLMPVIGRLTGGGNILYTTTLDVSNFSPGAVTVDYKFQGADVKTGAAISFSGTFVNDGGTKMRAFSDVRFDDFIDAMVQRGWITPAQEADGVLGSMVVVFEGVSAGNQAAARARFFSSQSGGTIGVSVNGHVLSTSDGTAVAGAFSDTRTIPGTPQLYSNIFLTNFGQLVNGQFVASDDTVTITAFSSATGQQIGTPLTVPIPSFRTLSTSLSALGVPEGAGAVIVLAKATSGQGILVGVGAEVDDATKDPSGFEMNAVPPSSTGPAPAGDLASQLAGNWIGTWNNNTFGSSGSAALAIVVNTSVKTYAVTLTLGGNVFGGTAPPPQTFSGSYSTASGATFTGHDSLFGDITFTITPAGVVTGSATNVPSSNVSAVSFSGTASATTITINYTVTLKPSGTATGVVTLTHS